ncbi:MAG: rhodanese-like domain-containing protein, partial [Pseudomonadota bacterium]
MIQKLDAREAYRRVHGDSEIAFLDLREAGPFSERHPLFAVPAPYSRLETIVGHLVPRPDMPIILIDGGDGIAEAGAEILASMGYSDIAVIAGGASAWANAGYRLFQGVNVPSKTLGELAEARWHPKTIDAQTLKDWQKEGRKFTLLDCRPPDEYQKMTIPGAICLPNGESAHRLPAIAHDSPLVVTCAGRTRSIIGSLGLARIAPDRDIYALENGTQGWALAGFDLDRGQEPQDLPEITADQAAETRRRADTLLDDEGIPRINADDVRRLLDDATRSAFTFDLRSKEEAAADPLPAFPHVWSGQLVQTTDRWIGVWRSRLVLADDLGLRAALAAVWLSALGFEVHVTQVDDRLRAIPAPPRPTAPPFAITKIGAGDALRETSKGRARLLDLRPSWEYASGHVATSIWAIRPKLAAWPGTDRLLLVGDKGSDAELGARELHRLGEKDLAIVEGGIQALRQAGALIEVAEPRPLGQAIDVISFAHGRHEGDLDASRRYLSWEQG